MSANREKAITVTLRGGFFHASFKRFFFSISLHEHIFDAYLRTIIYIISLSIRHKINNIREPEGKVFLKKCESTTINND